MARKTAVAAPPADPFDRLFVALDRMTGPQLRAFIVAVRQRFRLTS